MERYGRRAHIIYAGGIKEEVKETPKRNNKKRTTSEKRLIHAFGNFVISTTTIGTTLFIMSGLFIDWTQRDKILISIIVICSAILHLVCNKIATGSLLGAGGVRATYRPKTVETVSYVDCEFMCRKCELRSQCTYYNKE